MEIKVKNDKDEIEQVYIDGCGCAGCLLYIVIILTCVFIIKVLRYLLHIDISALF